MCSWGGEVGCCARGGETLLGEDEEIFPRVIMEGKCSVEVNLSCGNSGALV